MVDRDEFDEWLRERAVEAGATRLRATFKRFARDVDGCPLLHLAPLARVGNASPTELRARLVIGADGATSLVARQAMPNSVAPPMVYAYHEILRSPSTNSAGTAAARAAAGLTDAEVVRTEGAPIPMRPRKRWDNGRDVLLAGDAAGVVAPASGAGIYYAMVGGQLAAQAAAEFLASGEARALAGARRRFMRAHRPRVLDFRRHATFLVFA